MERCKRRLRATVAGASASSGVQQIGDYGRFVGGWVIEVWGWMIEVQVDKVFVSVYVITETNTTAAKSWTNDRGSNPCNPCFECSGSLQCGRDLRCHIELQTECSPATMAASAMFNL